MVVRPADPVLVEQVEDGAVGGTVNGAAQLVAGEPVGGTRDQKPTIGEGRPEAGGEPSVREREGPGQGVVEGQIVLGPIPHGNARIDGLPLILGAAHEAIVLASGPLRMAGLPGLAGYQGELLGRGQAVGGDGATLAGRVCRLRADPA